MLSLSIAGLLGYLLGSIPSAYVFVKWKSRLDIRNAGSGNVGTLNSYEVTGSKVVGGAVLAFDLFKGVGAVLLAQVLLGSEFWVSGVAGLGAVAGHNFPVWLQFKGGRGLATAAGTMLVIGWFLIVVWGVFWIAGKKLTKDINVGNAIACLASLAVIVIVPSDTLQGALTVETGATEFRAFAVLLFTLLLVRLVEPVREYIKLRKQT